MDSDRFLQLVEQFQADHPQITPLQASVIIAAREGISHDSRTFSRLFGVAHALVLREIGTLADQNQLSITRQDARTMRTHFEITENSGR